MTVVKLELCLFIFPSYSATYKQTSSWQDVKCYAWTDSTIALAWIKGDPSQWKIFIANRISQIHMLVNKGITFRYKITQHRHNINSTNLIQFVMEWAVMASKILRAIAKKTQSIQPQFLHHIHSKGKNPKFQK